MAKRCNTVCDLLMETLVEVKEGKRDKDNGLAVAAIADVMVKNAAHESKHRSNNFKKRARVDYFDKNQVVAKPISKEEKIHNAASVLATRSNEARKIKK